MAHADLKDFFHMLFHSYSLFNIFLVLLKSFIKISNVFVSVVFPRDKSVYQMQYFTEKMSPMKSCIRYSQFIYKLCVNILAVSQTPNTLTSQYFMDKFHKLISFNTI